MFITTSGDLVRKLGEIIPRSEWLAHRVSKRVFNELHKLSPKVSKKKIKKIKKLILTLTLIHNRN
jgi:hypothetical protein